VSIRGKILLVALPVLVTALTLAQGASYFAAIRGVDRAARRFLDFKKADLERYAANQWTLLMEAGYAGRDDMVEAARLAIAAYARGIALSDTEIIFALDAAGAVAMSTAPLELSPGETAALVALLDDDPGGLQTAVIGGTPRILEAFDTIPFGWRVVLSEDAARFYQDADRIRFQAAAALAAALVLGSLLLAVFARRVTRPLLRVAGAMDAVIAGGDLSRRVNVEYRDETGRVAAAFNHMTAALETAYSQIKRYAFDAALAGRKEQRVRQIFQKYVPKDVIDRCLAVTGSPLKIGEDRRLCILFSDIRGFTTISEGFKDRPDALVESLNRYFAGQVDAVMNRGGVVDKYIGDAVMALFPQEDGPDRAVRSAIDIQNKLLEYNSHRAKMGYNPLAIGVGIHIGNLMMGVVGVQDRMQNTVISDAVNHASRLEGMCKAYGVSIVISREIFMRLENPTLYFFRDLGPVKVKGKDVPDRVFEIFNGIDPELIELKKKANRYWEEGMMSYNKKDFSDALLKFQKYKEEIHADLAAYYYIGHCTDRLMKAKALKAR